MIKAKGTKGEKGLRFNKVFSDKDQMNEWAKINKAVISESAEVTVEKPGLDNDYTQLDSFLPHTIKPLDEGSGLMDGNEEYLDGKDEVGEFWVVTKPALYQNEQVTDSTIDDILFQSTILGMANQVRGGLDDRGQIFGFYKNEPTARKIAEGLLNDKKAWFRVK
jgi:hypothetical protein